MSSLYTVRRLGGFQIDGDGLLDQPIDNVFHSNDAIIIDGEISLLGDRKAGLNHNAVEVQ